MFYYSADGKKHTLNLLDLDQARDTKGRMFPSLKVSKSELASHFTVLANRAATSLFQMQSLQPSRASRASRISKKEMPVVFEEAGAMRMLHREIVVRLKSGVSAAMRDKILKKYGFKIRYRNPFIKRQFIAYHPDRKCVGAKLLDVANDWAEMDEIEFSSPNFVSEFRRAATIKIHPEQWHLNNKGSVSGQKAGEDVNARTAWKTTQGKPSIVVAVLDDGIDLEHPNLKSRILKNPNPNDSKDKVGRDFFLPNDHPDHYNPRPKLFQAPFDQMPGNDIHGSPCAGVIAADGKTDDVLGIAPKCKILAVKVFHADFLASDDRVANAIRYASTFADVLSCSWGGPFSNDIEFAIATDAANGRGGKGTAVFCAAGNEFASPVGHPASSPAAIAVGASTDQAKLANYSNVGPQISVVAPSSGGKRGIYTTDVAINQRGFNTGNAAAGGTDGLHTNDFGGTSSATPLAAGVAALALSIDPNLTRAEIKEILETTADKIGSGYDAKGHSNKFGFGRVNAASALKEVQARKAARSASKSSPNPKAPTKSRKATAKRKRADARKSPAKKKGRRRATSRKSSAVKAGAPTLSAVRNELKSRIRVMTNVTVTKNSTRLGSIPNLVIESLRIWINSRWFSDGGGLSPGTISGTSTITSTARVILAKLAS